MIHAHVTRRAPTGLSGPFGSTGLSGPADSAGLPGLAGSTGLTRSNAQTGLTALLGLSAAALMLLAGSMPSAHAAQRSAGEATYQQDVADCKAGRTNQSLHDCLYEARSALRDTRNGTLHSADPRTLQENAVERCSAHPAALAREACERMARGEGTVSGSVEAGGELTKIVTVVPAPMAASAPAN